MINLASEIQFHFPEWNIAMVNTFPGNKQNPKSANNYISNFNIDPTKVITNNYISQ